MNTLVNCTGWGRVIVWGKPQGFTMAVAEASVEGVVRVCDPGRTNVMLVMFSGQNVLPGQGVEQCV